MKMIVISSAPLVDDGKLSGYGPYIHEMDLWAKHVDEIGFLCPILRSGEGLLLKELHFPVAKLFEAKSFDVKSVSGMARAFFYAFYNFYLIYKAMRWADHIHLRCPGNISLMGCLVQILFPRKKKTAKYAGNWDPDAVQPVSYKIQRWLLANTFLTRNMQVLVYGQWPNSTRNVKAFFTASYLESDKLPVSPRRLKEKIRFLFVGTLSEGKRPMYALQLVESLSQAGHDVVLDFYGEGSERQALEDYIKTNQLQGIAVLHGNRPAEIVRQAYQDSHFLVLPSKSEGWPKVVAEAMFWGCFPLATGVSCVPYMLNEGRRGFVLLMVLDADVQSVSNIMSDQPQYDAKVSESISWSRQFTLDLFEKEIKALLG